MRTSLLHKIRGWNSKLFPEHLCLSFIDFKRNNPLCISFIVLVVESLEVSLSLLSVLVDAEMRMKKCF